jgi:hypothetical protein
MRRRRKRGDNDPFWLAARYPGKCRCGFEIKPGQQIFWYPNKRTAICRKCGLTAELEITDDDLNNIIHAMQHS